jgi:hypothetical protein
MSALLLETYLPRWRLTSAGEAHSMITAAISVLLAKCGGSATDERRVFREQRGLSIGLSVADLASTSERVCIMRSNYGPCLACISPIAD